MGKKEINQSLCLHLKGHAASSSPREEECCVRWCPFWPDSWFLLRSYHWPMPLLGPFSVSRLQSTEWSPLLCFRFQVISQQGNKPDPDPTARAGAVQADQGASLPSKISAPLPYHAATLEQVSKLHLPWLAPILTLKTRTYSLNITTFLSNKMYPFPVLEEA